MARLPATVILLLITVSAVFGCGVVPQGQMATRTFRVTGFTLPVTMVYSTTPKVLVQVPGILSTRESASSFTSRLIMQAVIDVLEQQGRAAGLADTIISAILDQLTVQISYEPQECKEVAVNADLVAGFNGVMMAMKPHCIIVGSTVTSLCTADTGTMCKIEMDSKIAPISANQTAISGTIRTTNFVMANWSREIWQSVVNRTLRTLTLSPFGSHFFSAVATVD
ncbi:hypothetical protein KIN20_003809 [Parelaphostrongylus tenuis]|uniref:Uncharacterized protein n=1 Tax=Parelaphostrongylus tenuis TaxID=148309 RepID=A0AAD5MIU4_PARTN|nr:hypothetical protein KIN20_003809 [Parelaphostrongylus tenuis]